MNYFTAGLNGYILLECNILIGGFCLPFHTRVLFKTVNAYLSLTGVVFSQTEDTLAREKLKRERGNH